MWALFAVLCVLTPIMAVNDRHMHNQPEPRPYRGSEIWPDIVRATGATFMFSGLALLTPVGSTCFFPVIDPTTRLPTGLSVVPDNAARGFCAVILFVALVLTNYLPILRTAFADMGPPQGAGPGGKGVGADYKGGPPSPPTPAPVSVKVDR